MTITATNDTEAPEVDEVPEIATLIGFTAKRGERYHYRTGTLGGRPNTYEDAVPATEVHERLFGWDAVEAELHALVRVPGGKKRQARDKTRKAIVRSDTLQVLGIARPGYQVHGYGEFLVDHIEAISEGGTAIGSAGTLRYGAQAYLQAELSETVEGPGGVQHRPFITAVSSLDGSLATTYWTGSTLLICDNQLAMARRDESDFQSKVRHTARSLGRLGDLRQKLGLDAVSRVADHFNDHVASLLGEKVEDARWGRFLDAYAAPSNDTKIAHGFARAKREALNELWATDERVSPWRGTAWGVVQAVNTYVTHEGIVRNLDGRTVEEVRAARVNERLVRGRYREIDQETLRVLAAV